jgi:hypothetical protein
VVLVFVVRDDTGHVLLVERPAGAAVYPGRLSTVGGDLAPGERVEDAGHRALIAELPAGAAAELVRGGLPVDFTDTVRRRSLSFRVHPLLARVAEDVPAARARWVEPDDVIVATALGKTLPELDEALARVLDPPAALPPHVRAEARALHGLAAPGRELARRALAIVAAGAPPERVAALRPALARVVNAARAAPTASRDVAGELLAATRAEARAVAAVTEGARAVAVHGDVPFDGPAVPVERADLLVIGAEAVLPHGDVVAPAGALAAVRIAAARGAAVLASADAWAAWPDDVPPPLPPDLELVPRDLLARVIGLEN